MTRNPACLSLPVRLSDTVTDSLRQTLPSTVLHRTDTDYERGGWSLSCPAVEVSRLGVRDELQVEGRVLTGRLLLVHLPYAGPETIPEVAPRRWQWAGATVVNTNTVPWMW
jgi:hypothetical protein